MIMIINGLPGRSEPKNFCKDKLYYVDCCSSGFQAICTAIFFVIFSNNYRYGQSFHRSAGSACYHSVFSD